MASELFVENVHRIWDLSDSGNLRCEVSADEQILEDVQVRFYSESGEYLVNRTINFPNTEVARAVARAIMSVADVLDALSEEARSRKEVE